MAETTLENQSPSAPMRGINTLLNWIRLYPLLYIGIFLLLFVFIFTYVGSRLTDRQLVRAGTTEIDLRPWQTIEYRIKGEDRSAFSVLGTDSQGAMFGRSHYTARH